MGKRTSVRFELYSIVNISQALSSYHYVSLGSMYVSTCFTPFFITDPSNLLRFISLNISIMNSGDCNIGERLKCLPELCPPVGPVSSVRVGPLFVLQDPALVLSCSHKQRLLSSKSQFRAFPVHVSRR